MLSKIDSLPFVNQKNALYLLLAMHLAGVVGLSIGQTRELFQALTPVNLFLTAAIVLHFEESKSAKYFLFIIITFILGFFVEVLGVKTGFIFGEYEYGSTLGFKFLDVPVAIGLNWVIMVYCTGLFARSVAHQSMPTILVGAGLMTIIDVLIEPVAIQLDFWNWTNEIVPIRNYMGWFVTSLVLQLLFYYLMPKSNNSLAVKLLYILIGFFIALNFI